MNLSLHRPIVFFDIESTGLNTIRDRIVEISLLKVFPDGKEEKCTYLLNPTVPISAESTSIHGFTNDAVKDKPTFKDVGNEIFEFIGTSDLGGFNVLKFDIPMLLEEFLRIGLSFNLKDRDVVDVQIIFHKMEERTLSAAYRFYCNKELVNAHSAEADTIATYEVFKAQIDRYEQLQKDVKFISEFTGVHKRVDLEGRILLNEKGQEVFNFGKHKGRPVEDVFMAEPTYYNWMMDGEFSAYTKNIITEIRLRMLKKKFQG